MKRRDFINTGLLTAITGALATPTILSSCKNTVSKKARNIIFMVSDGMSSGTLNMADLLLQKKEGRGSTWIDLYRNNRVTKAFVDTASANSLVTDSAAGSSAWGSGRRVNNSTLNVNPDGSFNKPILQKFKDAGKAVGCVTTVPITHATPAGFSVNFKHRNMQDKIASKYLELQFDVMMGGGTEYFDGSKREDKKDIFGDFENAGFQVVRNKQQMANATKGKPVIGVFHEDGLPYSLDLENDAELKAKIPTLAEMTRKAIELMGDQPEGFVLQVEGGKVDWAAHANDTTGLIYEQIDFDNAVAEAIKFAEGRDDTLVIITSDHGNANPGLIKSDKVDTKFETLFNVKHTNDWVLFGITKNDKPSHVIERIQHAQNIVISEDEARQLLKAYDSHEEGLYNAYNLPFEPLAQIQKNYTSVGWSGMNHSADFVELAMFGAGSEKLTPFIKNYELHNFMLQAAEVNELAIV
nr:alkaline phosphatase [uncultured Carboxylicivirga sp.]